MCPKQGAVKSLAIRCKDVWWSVLAQKEMAVLLVLVSQLLNPNLLGRPSEAEAVQLLGSKEAFQKERVIGQLEIDRILTPSIRPSPSIATMTGTC